VWNFVTALKRLSIPVVETGIMALEVVSLVPSADADAGLAAELADSAA
jgi:hypothetical protein